MIQLQFICKKCGNRSIEVVENAIITTEIVYLATDNTYPLRRKPSSIVKQNIIKFQCQCCGDVIKNNDEIISDFEKLTEFLLGCGE